MMEKPYQVKIHEDLLCTKQLLFSSISIPSLFTFDFVCFPLRKVYCYSLVLTHAFDPMRLSTN